MGGKVNLASGTNISVGVGGTGRVLVGIGVRVGGSSKACVGAGVI